jgi:hypothetical protein
MLTKLLLVPSLKMNAAMPLFLLKPPLPVEGQIYSHFNIIFCCVKSLKLGDDENFLNVMSYTFLINRICFEIIFCTK